MTRWLAASLLLGTAAAAQDLSLDPPTRPDNLDAVPGPGPGPEPEKGGAAAPAGSAASARGATVRVLDKIDGTIADLDLADGETAEVGSLTVTLAECRYPADNPSGDAYALLSIRTKADDAAVFEGWMIASTPALSAMDHPRYDVWALRCQGT